MDRRKKRGGQEERKRDRRIGADSVKASITRWWVGDSDWGGRAAGPIKVCKLAPQCMGLADRRDEAGRKVNKSFAPLL